MKRKFSIYHFLIALLMFTIMSPAFVGATVNNTERNTGTLTIHKLALEPNVEPGEKGNGDEMVPPPAGEPVEGVTYQVKQTHSFDGLHWTEINNGLEFTMTTDENGTVTRENLPLGRYEIGEISGPDYVNLNPDTFSVDIPMTSEDGTKVNYDVHIYPKNELIRGGAKLIKYANETNETLQGVKIKVFHADGTPVLDKDTNEEIILTTDHNGSVSIDGLRYGDYYFQEVATIDGYLLNQEPIPFSVTESGVIVNVELQNYSKPDVEKDVDKEAVNRGEIVEFTISVNLPLDIEDYVKFDVIDQLHENLLYVEGSANSPTGFTFSYDNDTKTLTWTGDPQNLSSGVVTFTFKAQVSPTATANVPIENEAEIDYDNGYEERTEKTPPTTVTPTVGSLTVIKRDGSTGYSLSGAEFEVRDASGNIVASGTSGIDGVVDFGGDTDELDYGNYTLHETKAPEGYRMLTKPIEFTIGDGVEKHDVTITVDNYESGWELPRTGGMGTVLYSLVGLTLMGTAGVLYTRRKRSEQA